MPELFASWGFWYAVGGAIVVVAAALLIAILLVARGIEKEAARALAAGARIRDHTDALFLLGGALEALETLRDRAAAVEEKTALLGRTVHGEAEGAGRVGP